MPLSGTVVITNATSGAFRYTPNANFNGTDTFTYKANDGTADSNIATVTVTITPVNDGPVASNGALSVSGTQPKTGALVATDADANPLTYSIVTNGGRGTATITNASTGAYTYTASTNVSATDTFTFRANDGTANSNTATVTVTIAVRGKVIWYVDGSIPFPGDGKSWSAAFKTVQGAVDAAIAGDEIWVRASDYKLTMPVVVNKALSIYGGFAGTENLRDARNWRANATTLDGQGNTQCLLVSANATVDGFVITNCHGVFGGAVMVSDVAATVANCRFNSNSANSGGAVYAQDATVSFSNCSFTNNSASLGGALYNENSLATIGSCSFTGNTASSGGGAIGNNNTGTVTIVNSILWGDKHGGTANEIDNAGGTITATYSDVEGGYAGTGNLDSDPLFIDAASGTLNLRRTSPCIDHGTPSGTGLAGKDLDGNTRVVDGNSDGSAIVDMGAFEYNPLVASLGVFTNGTWYFDRNNNYVRESNLDLTVPNFGFPGAIPVVGDWNGSGVTGIGVFSNGLWYLDMNHNGIWDGAAVDRYYSDFGKGLPNAIPVTGDWVGSTHGTTKIGVFSNGTWYLDMNGNGAWGAGDVMVSNFGKGLPNAIPVVGNWPGSTGAGDKIGVFSNGTWYLDMNGNGVWDPSVDLMVSDFGKGLSNAMPVVGDWTNTGQLRIGVFSNGTWYLDINGNGVWDPGVDLVVSDFGKGLPAARPVVVRW